MRRYHLIPGTGEPGENRGGLAVRLDFEFAHPHSVVTARGMERFKLAPWGVNGGRAETSGSCVVNRDTPRARDIGRLKLVIYMAFRCDRAPFTDKRVRQAINHAVDREVTAKNILRGKAQACWEVRCRAAA